MEYGAIARQHARRRQLQRRLRSERWTPSRPHADARTPTLVRRARASVASHYHTNNCAFSWCAPP
jgi:hypothetical protein